MKNTENITEALSIPREMLNKTINGAFFVKINKNYSATVKNLSSFIDYIQMYSHDLDESFGEIEKDSKEDYDFYNHLLEVICYVNGFAKFNTNPHQFVELKNEKETVSIRTKSGKLVTICFSELSRSADVVLHNSGMQSIDNGSPVPQFEVMGLKCGETPIKSTPVTISVIQLGKKISS